VQETLYFDKVSQEQSGWFDLPDVFGAFNLTVSYGGHTYLFRTAPYPGSTTCLVLAVPSGVVNLAVYQFSNYDCAGNLRGWAANATYSCFGQVYLHVLSDADSASVAGAVVTTSYDFPTTCVFTGCPYPSCLSGEGFKSFTTTTSTEWYAFGDAANSFSVIYGGQAYNVTASQRAASTCVTLRVPSGAVDRTYGPGCVVGEPSTTSTSTTVNLPACGAPTNTVLNPAPKGTAYMKVVTDQGTVITNGSLFVTQVGNMSWGSGVQTHYCINLSDVNGTGYLQLATKNTLNRLDANFITSGYYNVTLMAGYNLGQGYLATIPSIQVHSNSTVYVTVSVPSGVVTVVTSNEGSSAVTTTTTTESSTSTTLKSSTTRCASTTTVTASSSTTFLSTSTLSTASSTGSSPSILAAEVANVTLAPWPGQIAVNPVTGKVYVSDLFANTLTVLNASNRAIIRTITLPGTPGSGIAVDTKKDMVYVSVAGCTNLPNVINSCNSPCGEQKGGGIIVIDGRNNTIVGEFPIHVQRLAIDPTRQVLYGVSTAYVSTLGPVYLLSYDEDSGTVLSYKPLDGATPPDVAVNSQSNMVYLSANAEVLAINETSHRVQWAGLGYDAINFPLVFDSANHWVYVMGEKGANLTLDAIDGLTGNLLYSASLGSSCAGAGGGRMVVDTTSNRLYVVSDRENFLLVIDGGTGKLVGTLNTPQSGGEYNIGLNPATHEVYLTSESSSHPNTGYFVVLSGEGLDRISQVEQGFLQRGACVP
jgi:YVTN family beta-propeller protein